MNIVKVLTTFFFALTYATVSHATVITFGFEGNASGEGLPGGDCGPITCAEKYEDILYAPFSGLIKFDSNAVDQAPNNPEVGVYVSSGDPYGIRFVIGDFIGQSTETRIGVQATGNPFTQYNFLATDLGPMFTQIALWNCYDHLSGIITTDALLTTPPPAGSNGCYDPAFIRTYDGYDIALNVSRYFLVPEPGTIALFGIGLIGMGASVRSKTLVNQG